MKLSSYLAAATVLAQFIFVSCSEDEDPNPIEFDVQVLTYDSNGDDFLGADASLTVTADGEVVYDDNIVAGFNNLVIPEGKTTYHVKLAKDGYDSFEKDFTAEELSQPFEVRLFLTLNSHLMAWYPFTGNFEDASGNELHGTKTGNPVLTEDRNGVANSAYQFNGINYVTIPSETLELNEYTYSVWVNTTTPPEVGFTGNVFSIGDVNTSKHQSINISNKYGTAESTGWCVGGWNNGGPFLNSGVTTDNMPLQQRWYHIVMLRYGGAIRMYLDNRLVGSADTGSAPALYENSVVANIGIRCNYTQGFVGKIDELRIYDRALNGDEIGNLFYKP